MITSKVRKPELLFLYAICCLILFYISTKYHQYIPKGIQVIEWMKSFKHKTKIHWCWRLWRRWCRRQQDLSKKQYVPPSFGKKEMIMQKVSAVQGHSCNAAPTSLFDIHTTGKATGAVHNEVLHNGAFLFFCSFQQRKFQFFRSSFVFTKQKI